MLCVANGDGTVHLFDMNAKSLIHSMKGTEPIRAAALIHDKSHLLAVGASSFAIYNLEKKEQTHCIKHDVKITSATLSNGKVFISEGENEVLVYDPQTRLIETRIEFKSKIACLCNVRNVPNVQVVAVSAPSDTEHVINVFNLDSTELLCSFQSPNDEIYTTADVKILDSQYLTATWHGNTEETSAKQLHVFYNLRNGKEIARHEADTSSWQVKGKYGSILAVANSDDEQLELWDIIGMTKLFSTNFELDSRKQFVARDEGFLLVANSDGIIEIIDLVKMSKVDASININEIEEDADIAAILLLNEPLDRILQQASGVIVADYPSFKPLPNLREKHGDTFELVFETKRRIDSIVGRSIGTIAEMQDMIRKYNEKVPKVVSGKIKITLKKKEGLDNSANAINK